MQIRTDFSSNFNNRRNIKAEGFSTDGDPRALSSMKNLLQCLLHKGDVIQNVSNEQNVSCAQDSVHIATKMRNTVLKPSILLPMGAFQVSVAHLKILISTISKDSHGLVWSDICPDDRQNYSSFQKMCDESIMDCLKRYVSDSEATI